MVKSMEDENRVQLNMETFRALGPLVAKLTELMDFQEAAIKVFCANVANLAAAKGSRLVPEGIYTALIKMVDALQKVRARERGGKRWRGEKWSLFQPVPR